MVEPLTDIERRIFDYMVDYLRQNTYQPSIREIGRRFNIKSTKTVSEYLQALARKGWVERDPSRSRGVRLLGVELNIEPVGEADRRAPADLRVAAAPAAGSAVAATSEGARELGVRSGDLLALEGAEEQALDDGDAVVCRYEGQTSAGRCRTVGAGLGLEWNAGRMLALRPERAPGLEVLGRAAGLWRPFARPPGGDGARPDPSARVMS